MTGVVEPAQRFFETLTNREAPITERYIAIFELKNLKNEEAVNLMRDSFPSLGESELLKHELVYTLGQLEERFYPLIKDFLYERVRDSQEQKLVRHEAAEAIANYFDQQAIPLLEKELTSGVEYLRQTCQLSLDKIQHHHKELFGLQYQHTRQPAAPFSAQQFKDFLQDNNLKEVYTSEGFIGVLAAPLPLPTKYRILYHMRDLSSNKCKLQLCKLLSKQHFKTFPALFKHEVCFVLGQIGIEEGAQEALVRECIENQEEEDIVRHEALAAVASQSKDEKYLEQFSSHPSQIIRESAEVAIGEIKYWHS